MSISSATGISPAFVVGIQATESNGNPRALRFEPHVLLKLRPQAVARLSPTPGAAFVTADEERADAWSRGLVPYTRGKTRAASDSRAETDRHAFDFAVMVDPSDAVRSTSFGLYQDLGRWLVEAELPTLGHHWLELSDANALTALHRFDADPVGASDAMLIAWLRGNPRALAAAKAGQIDLFIHLYNGCALAETGRYRKRFDPAYMRAGGKL